MHLQQNNITVEKKNIAILSNVTVGLIKQKLSKKYNIYIPSGYDAWISEILNISSEFYANKYEAIFVLLDGTEYQCCADCSEMIEKIGVWKQVIDFLVGNTKNVPIFVSTIDVREHRIHAVSERIYHYQIQHDWYDFIQKNVEQNKNVYVFDLADKISDIGRNYFYSNKMWYMGNMPYSKTGIQLICEEIERLLECIFQIRRKILVLDLDNTLWGGVIGEDGIDGILLAEHKEGSTFYEFQRLIFEMKKRGVLLAINSKNNFTDVEGVFDLHTAMVLKKNDFVSLKINWNDKASNIKQMETELNLTEGSFVFVDDNPIERELVKGECLEVIVPEFPKDIVELKQFAEDLYIKYFRPLQILEEDKTKTEMYLTDIKRKEEMQQSLNLDDYIKKLEIQMDMHRMKVSEIERVVQLCNKTNQFNLTTKRYTISEIENLSKDNNTFIYTVHAKDRYGENGLVSVLILKKKDSQLFIDTFLMSCRVMGRKIEYAVLNEVVEFFKDSITTLIGTYIPTAKNKPVEKLYDLMGFTLKEESENCKEYEFDLNNVNMNGVKSFMKIKFEG